MRVHHGLVISIVLLGACGTTATETPHDTDAAAGESAVLADLPDSGRWNANEATVDGIERMMELVEGYPENGLDGVQLGDSLDEHMAMIFERCTMEGQAHEALHAYLLPLLSMYRALPDEPTAAALDSITNHLALFDEQFR